MVGHGCKCIVPKTTPFWRQSISGIRSRIRLLERVLSIAFRWGKRKYKYVPEKENAGRALANMLVFVCYQIWFQNRRQNDRRKSKPLQPHELLAPRAVADQLRQESENNDHAVAEQGVGHFDGHGKDPATMQSSFESDPSGSDDKDEPEQSLQSSQASLESESSDMVPQPPTEVPEPDPLPLQSSQDTQPDASQPNSAKRKRSVTDLRGDASEAPPAETDASKEKSPPSLRLSLSFDGEAIVRKEGELTPSPPKGRNALRISMSSDGKAVIRADDEPSPSKNRISMFSNRRPRFTGLRRSNSAILPRTPRAAATGEKERVFGRSRDPRNWESVFDTDARSALSTPASAQTAPHSSSSGLFRSRSQRSLTQSLSAKQNVFAISPGHPDTPVPLQSGDKRRKLSRTVSSLGRLESSNRANPMGNVSGNPLKVSKVPTQTKKDSEGLENGDSDKENWIPGTRISNIRRRTTSHPQRPVLKEANRKDGKPQNLAAAGKRSRLAQGQYQQRKTNAGNGTPAPEIGPEVSAFMAGGGSASQEEDLDCIHGLLSLSQGAWR